MIPVDVIEGVEFLMAEDLTVDHFPKTALNHLFNGMLGFAARADGLFLAHLDTQGFELVFQ
jgi:N-acetylglucosamine-6-phosphate deacetylase